MSTATQPFTGTFVADPGHSTFGFAVRHMRVSTFRATFSDVRASLVVNENAIALRGSARADSVSISAPAEFREHVVNGAEFFDASNHPDITFVADDVQVADDGSLSGAGRLTIRGVTRPVTATGSYRAPIEHPYGGQVASVELTATVDRREWGMDWQMPLPGGGDVLEYEVQLSASIELVQEA